ncbi:hypothetical protein [Rhodococcus sp. AH-ZY2]|uniref:hypothetical protein n=1 Tax=Rhodococcus sp. AH-ZY2 TaxID=3047468 RepID=UPI0027E01343|nr:hypothetical protein [Rhodococcus sp. AH-ZY2]WML63638.1 hypothetical protein QNA09_02130 [Rhodococcus sp. AH-ZY2]
MTDREELTNIIRAPRIHTNTSGDKQRAIADAILAAGYRKPRTVTTIEELDKLPDGAVIRGAHGQISVIHRGQVDGRPYIEVHYAGTEEIDFDYQYISLPAMVLYAPEDRP